MSNWKAILSVMGGSFIVLFLVVFGLSQLSSQTSQKRVEGTEGESRLVLGKSEAKVTIVEFSDFQCPACQAAQPLVKKILSDDRVKLIFRHLPLYEIHKNAEAAALAAEAAASQGKFEEYHDLLFENRDWVNEKDPTGKLVEMAEKINLDKNRFENDLKNKAFKDLVDRDVSAASRYLVTATPTFFVNGIKTSTRDLESVVKQELEKN